MAPWPARVHGLTGLALLDRICAMMPRLRRRASAAGDRQQRVAAVGTALRRRLFFGKAILTAQGAQRALPAHGPARRMRNAEIDARTTAAEAVQHGRRSCSARVAARTPL